MTNITKALDELETATSFSSRSARDNHAKNIAALRAALQDKAEVRGDEVGRSGHYFQFERGEWAKNGDEPTKFWPASGLHYVGRLTKDQREGLDKLIRDYLEGAQPAPVVPDDVARDAGWFRLIRDGSGWPAVFASHDAPEPLRGDDLDAAMIAASQQSKPAVTVTPDYAECLDWIERQHLEELGMGMVIDAPNDGQYYVCGDSGTTHYGKTLRDAIKGAIAASQQKGGR